MIDLEAIRYRITHLSPKSMWEWDIEDFEPCLKDIQALLKEVEILRDILDKQVDLSIP